MLLPSENPTPDKTCTQQCCARPFVSFFSPQMNSCGYWKTARSDVQTTTRAFHIHLVGTLGNVPTRSPEPLHDSVAGADAGPGESCAMKAQNASNPNLSLKLQRLILPPPAELQL